MLQRLAWSYSSYSPLMIEKGHLGVWGTRVEMNRSIRPQRTSTKFLLKYTPSWSRWSVQSRRQDGGERSAVPPPTVMKAFLVAALLGVVSQCQAKTTEVGVPA